MPSWGTGRSTRLDEKPSVRGELTAGSDSAGFARQEAEKVGAELGAWPGRDFHGRTGEGVEAVERHGNGRSREEQRRLQEGDPGKPP